MKRLLALLLACLLLGHNEISSLLGVFRPPGRVTFGRCPKSDQKDNQKPRFLDFLHAMLILPL